MPLDPSIILRSNNSVARGRRNSQDRRMSRDAYNRDATLKDLQIQNAQRQADSYDPNYESKVKEANLANIDLNQRKEQLLMMGQQLQMIDKAVSQSRDPVSYQGNLQMLSAMGVDEKLLSSLPQQWSPDIQKQATGRLIPVAEQWKRDWEEIKFSANQKQKDEDQAIASQQKDKPPVGYEATNDGLRPIKGGPYDPATISAKKQAEERGEEMAGFDPEKIQSESEYMVNLLTTVLEHPGLSDVVGAPNPFTKWTPGTDAADFKAYLDQVKGKQFMEAYKTLKGGGQITEIEGRKATDAMARMSTAQSEKAFKAGVKDFMEVVASLRDRMLSKGGTEVTNDIANKGPTPQTQSEYDSLPSGTIYVDPDDGQRYRKP